MKPILKIQFSDFWPGFIVRENYLYRLLNKKYELILSDDPEVLIYSCFGNQFLKFKCLRIFFTSENRKTNFLETDYSISFEFRRNKRQYRLPYFATRILESNLLGQLKSPGFEESLRLYDSRKFCAMVVSNPRSYERINFFKKLNCLLTVDSGGRYLNTIGGPILNKIDFIKNYRFVLSFENERFPGYLTEKIVDAFLSNSIPIYWGDPLVSKVFNPKRFIDRSEFESDEDCIREIIKVNSDPHRYAKILSEPIFIEPLPDYLEENRLLDFLLCAIEQRDKKYLVANYYKSTLAYCKRRIVKIKANLTKK
ncbi:glycosyltransferase family 10 domain-containing protein [Leeuwenhoekiella nanhaiensis]|uniref:Uncharacterized protein n=1 Tax=Leeuwenhoekiella nanhaiensis TaxID=1655491 RepID=A0A2G1VPF7_9FLAO|nr:glycosyltransferase family 10 [Leeuwenhoekiella nanhaiensis]PHQ28657.1 hypothetical protein CJ305_14205 [Leeuwenhoekiella nanhaiensis]